MYHSSAHRICVYEPDSHLIRPNPIWYNYPCIAALSCHIPCYAWSTSVLSIALFMRFKVPNLYSPVCIAMNGWWFIWMDKLMQQRGKPALIAFYSLNNLLAAKTVLNAFHGKWALNNRYTCKFYMYYLKNPNKITYLLIYRHNMISVSQYIVTESNYP